MLQRHARYCTHTNCKGKWARCCGFGLILCGGPLDWRLQVTAKDDEQAARPNKRLRIAHPCPLPPPGDCQGPPSCCPKQPRLQATKRNASPHPRVGVGILLLQEGRPGCARMPTRTCAHARLHVGGEEVCVLTGANACARRASLAIAALLGSMRVSYTMVCSALLARPPGTCSSGAGKARMGRDCVNCPEGIWRCVRLGSSAPCANSPRRRASLSPGQRVLCACVRACASSQHLHVLHACGCANTHAPRVCVCVCVCVCVGPSRTCVYIYTLAHASACVHACMRAC